MADNFPSTSPGAAGIQYREPLIFEKSQAGRAGVSLPAAGVPEVDPAVELPKELLRGEIEHMPAVTETEAFRHFVRLSQQNYGLDTGFYPLGSCTMKYNPKINEWAARLPGFGGAHPMAHFDQCQGALELMYRLERALTEIAGMYETTLEPAAGAQGELTGLMMVRAYHLDKHGTPRKKVLIPDSAHGTNPASAALNGYDVVELKSNREGVLEPGVVAAAMSDDVACLMMTNPNTIGVFERHVKEIAEIVHGKGGLLYGDGANMNALLGMARPGDMGVDVMQYNLHKTFSTPHGGGGPGSGPVAVGKILAPYLPRPRVVKDGDKYRMDFTGEKSVGKLRTFWGNFGMMVRAYAYIRELGPEGLKACSQLAVLNAQYLRALLSDEYQMAYETRSLHEVVFSDKKQEEHGVKTMDIAKRLIDHGFHPPTVYFPLIVHNALMIEPTETETKENVEAFAEAMKAIAREAREDAQAVQAAPQRTLVQRLDEVRAARKPILRWTPGLKVE